MKPPDAPHDFSDLVNGRRPFLRSAARPVHFDGGELGHDNFTAKERAERKRIRTARRVTRDGLFDRGQTMKASERGRI